MQMRHAGRPGDGWALSGMTSRSKDAPSCGLTNKTLGSAMLAASLTRDGRHVAFTVERPRDLGHDLPFDVRL